MRRNAELMLTLGLTLVLGCGRAEKSAAPSIEQSEKNQPAAAEPPPPGYAETPEEPREPSAYSRRSTGDDFKGEEAKPSEPAADYAPVPEPTPAQPKSQPESGLAAPPATTIDMPPELTGKLDPYGGTLGPKDAGGFALHGVGANGAVDEVVNLGSGTKTLAAPSDEPADPAKPIVEELEREEVSKRELDAERAATEARGRRYSRRDGDMNVESFGDDAERTVAPATVLPRTFYFENTYLGGSAAYAERLRRLDQALGAGERHYRRVQAETQPFDAPDRDGLGVTASVNVTHIDQPQRVFLQIGIQGSDRYGWRRPPLDLVLVIDRAAFAHGDAFVTTFVSQVLRKLDSADRLGVVVAGEEPTTFLDIARLATAQQHLARAIDSLDAPTTGSDLSLSKAMTRAAQMLSAASDDEAIVPGTQTVLVLTGGDGNARVAAATQAAHDLTVQGAVTSVFTVDSQEGEWWQVANAGYGNFHRITTNVFMAAIDEELASLARVVARLVRVNVRLGKDVDAIRVLGTRVLEQREVAAVKAREVAQDRSLSKTMGIVSDRGEDDDGIQTVIPYFYGDDSHVILIELWVKRPGTVADVTVRYKDMVNLDNATTRTSVLLGARPQLPTPEQSLIAQNVRGFMLGESLQQAALRVRQGDAAGALQAIEGAGAMAAETNDMDRAAVKGLRDLIVQPSWQNDAGRRSAVEETLLISGQRRVGDTNQQQQK